MNKSSKHVSSKISSLGYAMQLHLWPQLRNKMVISLSFKKHCDWHLKKWILYIYVYCSTLLGRSM